VIPTIYGCIAHLEPESPIKLPWSGELIQAEDLRPEVQAARKLLYDDMVARWKTDMPTDRLRFYCTATMLDPRHNNMQFPGLTNAFRAIARDWFISEFDALWRVDEEEPDSSGSADGEQPTTGKKKHTQHEGASFIDFLYFQNTFNIMMVHIVV